MSTGTAAGSRMADANGGEMNLRALARTGTVHFMGIAGAGMSALAQLMLAAGGRVTGCDLRPGPVGRALVAAGAEVSPGHDPEHVADAVALVATSAIPADHAELEAARRRGMPVLKRAQALGALVNAGRVLAIAGTHGKTTTTAMTTSILVEAGLDPTGFVGGRVAAWGGGLRSGSDKLFVVEADEYDRSFLTLRPDAAVVTTVEADHLDIYDSVEGIERAFLDFVEPVGDDGLVIACADDPGAQRLLDSVAGSRPTLSYGLGPAARLRATEIEARGGAMAFTVEEFGESLGRIELGVPGEHNVRNALAGLAAARFAGADLDAAARALAAFEGVGRRFERVGEAAGAVIVDDYAHHPTEITATLHAARQAYPDRRLVAVFQPHLYTRTRDFSDAFGSALTGADASWITDVYPAREKPIPGVTGERVATAAEEAGAVAVHYEPDRERLADALTAALRPGDICITLGAGDIDEVGREVLARLKSGAGS